MMNTVSRSHDDHKSPDLPIALYPNRMRRGNGGLTYYAKTIIRGVCTNEDIVNDILVSGLGGGLSREQLLTVAELLKNARLSRIADGYAVDDGISRIHACVSGTFETAGDSFSTKRHSISLSSRTTAYVQKLLATLRPVIRQGNTNRPVITEVRDLESGQSDTLTRGGFLDIRGANIRIGGTAAEVGLYFTHTEDSGKDVRLTADRLGMNKAKRIACAVPQGLADGTYRTKIVTQFINTKTMRKEPLSFLLETPLTVV